VIADNRDDPKIEAFDCRRRFVHRSHEIGCAGERITG
jgi:hypothetical protein